MVAPTMAVTQFDPAATEVAVQNTTLDQTLFSPVLTFVVDSADQDIAVVDADGVVTGLAAGTATITVTYNEDERFQSSYEVTVAADPITGGTLEPADSTASTTLNPNGVLALAATFRNAAVGRIAPIDDVLEIEFASSDTTIATVDEDGIVTAKTKAGTTTITATMAGYSRTLPITVALLPVDHSTVTPDPTRVAVGDSVALTATAYDAEGTVALGYTIDWSSNNPVVASVDTAGVVTGELASPSTPVTITATAGGKSGTARVFVDPAQ